jgi:hypothetical protein
VISRIRDAKYGLVAHGNLAAAAPTAATAFVTESLDYGVTSTPKC